MIAPIIWHGGDWRTHVVLCAVYGKKPAQKQRDHREQLLASHKPVEKMAGRRMVRPAFHMVHEPCCTVCVTFAGGRRWAC